MGVRSLDLFLVGVVMVFLVGVVYVVAWGSGDFSLHGHTGDNVFIHINGENKSLQAAIDDGDFSAPLGGSYLNSVLHGHSGEEIIVNVGGTTKSFQEAINDLSLCSASGVSPPNFGSGFYGNTGDEVRVTTTSVKDLQTAINDGDFNCSRNLALIGVPRGFWNSGDPASNINDGNVNSYVGSSCYADGCGTSLIAAVNFSAPVQVKNLTIHSYLNWGGSSSRWGGYANVTVLSNGVWVEVPRTWDTVVADERDWGYTPPGDVILNVSGSWSNVTSVRVRLYGLIGGHSSGVWLRVYEIEVLG